MPSRGADRTSGKDIYHQMSMGWKSVITAIVEYARKSKRNQMRPLTVIARFLIVALSPNMTKSRASIARDFGARISTIRNRIH